ncbi:hypothetical protein OSTOST_19790 [Ostertagia ostertagi]
MPKSSGDGTASAHPAQLEVVLQTMLQQLQFQHEEMKMLFASLAPTKDGMVDNQKLLYDQLNKDVEKFVYDEESGYTFRLLVQKKTLIRRRYECLRITCPALTSDYVPFRDYANTIKRMDEEASLKEMDYTALKTLQFVAGLQDPSLREVRLRMLRRLDTQAEDAPLTIEDLVAECENFTALKMDNANMGTSHDVHAVQKKKVKCFKCGGPHYRNVCPLLANQPKMSDQIPKKPRRQHYRQFLKCYRRTPCTSTPGQLSPAELFLGRQIRTTLTLLKETTEGEKDQEMQKWKSNSTVTTEHVKDRTRSENQFGFETIVLDTSNGSLHT